MSQAFPAQLDVIVELARFGVVKWREDGKVALVSPVPCPFNYGSVPGTRAADGEREDAVILGPRLAAGTRLRLPVLGRVLFEDAGLIDDKWLCAEGPLRPSERRQVQLFFTCYAQAKRVLNALAGARGATRYRGLELAR